MDSPVSPPESPAEYRMPMFWKAFIGFLMVACAALCMQVIWLTREIRSLHSAGSEAVESAGAAGLTIGERLTTLTPMGLAPTDGAANPLDFADGRPGTLLVLVGGACETCTLTLPYFNTLRGMWADSGVEFVGVELDATDPAQLHHTAHAEFPMLCVEHGEKTWLRRVPLVPAAVLIDNQGVVRRTWFGVLSARQQQELAEALEGARRGWGGGVGDSN